MPNGYNDDDEFAPEPESNRVRTIALVAGAVALSLILVTVGVLVLRPGSKPSQAANSDPLTTSATPGTTPTLDPTTTNLFVTNLGQAQSQQQQLTSLLSLDQSILLVLPQLLAMIALTVLLFAIAYVLFLRQEVRA